MREIVLDTETTGLEPADGHRIVEIGCVELMDRLPTGRIYHTLINPERDMPIEAFHVHGLSSELLAEEKPFRELYTGFLEFIGPDAPLVIHNARFDMKFLNAELNRLDQETIPYQRAIDTLALAKEKFPGSPFSLDALCKRFKIDNTMRQKHSALLDADLLAQVYLELTGGRQNSLFLEAEMKVNKSSTLLKTMPLSPRLKRTFTPNEVEKENHSKFLEKIKNPIWLP